MNVTGVIIRVLAWPRSEIRGTVDCGCHWKNERHVVLAVSGKYSDNRVCRPSSGFYIERPRHGIVPDSFRRRVCP